MVISEEKKYCAYCAELLKGRSDKKFCDDGCRNAFFNDLKKEDHEKMRVVELALKKNRKILKEMLGNRKARNVREIELLEKGFQFKYHTHHFTTRNKDTYTYCFEYGYLEREEYTYTIVKEINVQNF